MSLILKPVAIHSIVGNAPYIISVAATASPATGRVFTGTGAPGSSTLNTGNGMFNGLQGGFLINASLYLAGSGYVVNDALVISGGTGSAMQLTVDMVTASGGIQDFHVSAVGSYSAYPGAIEGVSGGTGSGAQFLPNVPPPDYYIDTTILSAPVLYVCTTSGTSNTSVWAKVSGGGSGGVQQFKLVSDGGDYWVCNTWDGTTQGTLNVNVVKPYKLRAGTNAIGSETIRGVTYTYTYTGIYISGSSGPYAYYTRAVSGSDGSNETDYMTPDPIAGDIIYGTPVTTNICSGVPTTVASVAQVNGGSGYSVNQMLTLSTGTGTAATIKVLTVSSGAIATFQLMTGGNYTSNPTLTNCGVTTGSATFNVTMAPQLLDLNTDARAWSK